MRVILLHGGGLGPWSWRRHVDLLPFESHVPVLPGHRGSEIDVFSMECAVAQVVRLAEGLGEPVVLAGLSLGGQVAVEVAAARPDLVRCVVASGVNLVGLPMVGALTASLTLMKPVLKSRAALRASARSMGLVQDLEELVADAAVNTPRRLSAIYRASAAVRLPDGLPVERVLVLAGEREPRPIRRSLALFHAAGATTQTVPGGRHTWPLTDPETFVAHTRAWIEAVAVPPLRS